MFKKQSIALRFSTMGERMRNKLLANIRWHYMNSWEVFREYREEHAEDMLQIRLEKG